MIISPNDPGVLLVGANRLFKSTDRGDSWVAISPDLTTNTNRDTVVTMGLKGADIRISRDDGISAYSTIVNFAESPKVPGVYYTGTDDGVVSVSRDGGKTWANITSHIPGFPAGAFVSEVVPSKFDAGDGLPHRRQPPAQRLRHAHVGQQRFRRDVPLDERQPRRRSRQDADRRSEESPTCCTSAPRRASSCRSIAARAGAASRRTSRRSASTRSRCTRATTRCSSPRTAARSGFSITSSRFRNTPRPPRRRPTQSCSRFRRRSSGRPRMTRTKSSGGTSTGSARIRRTTP